MNISLDPDIGATRLDRHPDSERRRSTRASRRTAGRRCRPSVWGATIECSRSTSPASQKAACRRGPAFHQQRRNVPLQAARLQRRSSEIVAAATTAAPARLRAPLTRSGHCVASRARSVNIMTGPSCERREDARARLGSAAGDRTPPAPAAGRGGTRAPSAPDRRSAWSRTRPRWRQRPRAAAASCDSPPPTDSCVRCAGAAATRASRLAAAFSTTSGRRSRLHRDERAGSAAAPRLRRGRRRPRCPRRAIRRSPSADARIGIAHRGDDTRDAGVDHASRARAGAPGMAARLERHVERAAAGTRPRLVERVALPRAARRRARASRDRRRRRPPRRRRRRPSDSASCAPPARRMKQRPPHQVARSAAVGTTFPGTALRRSRSGRTAAAEPKSRTRPERGTFNSLRTCAASTATS